VPLKGKTERVRLYAPNAVAANGRRDGGEAADHDEVDAAAAARRAD
jgi:hypothetical protein